jgi:hypothetical protein
MFVVTTDIQDQVTHISLSINNIQNCCGLSTIAIICQQIKVTFIEMIIDIFTRIKITGNGLVASIT